MGLSSEFYASDVHMMCRAIRTRYQVARMAKSRERDRQSAFELMSETTKQVLHVTQKVKQISSNNIDRNGKHAIRKTTPIAPERPLMIE
jgi:hypothetical protein